MIQIYEKVQASRATALARLTPVYQATYAQIDEEIKQMNELDLMEHFKPSPNDYALRKRLWNLVDDPTIGLVGDDLLAGDIVSGQNIRQNIRTNPHKFLWLLTPMDTFKEMYEEAFYISFQKIRKFLLTNEVNSLNLTAFMKLHSSLENRVLGPVATNINVRTQKVLSQPSDLKNVTPEELDQKIKELEAKSTTATPADVLPE